MVNSHYMGKHYRYYWTLRLDKDVFMRSSAWHCQRSSVAYARGSIYLLIGLRTWDDDEIEFWWEAFPKVICKGTLSGVVAVCPCRGSAESCCWISRLPGVTPGCKYGTCTPDGGPSRQIRSRQYAPPTRSETWRGGWGKQASFSDGANVAFAYVRRQVNV